MSCTHCNHGLEEHTAHFYSSELGLLKTRCVHQDCSCVRYHGAELDALNSDVANADALVAAADASEQAAQQQLDAAQSAVDVAKAVDQQAMENRDVEVDELNKFGGV